MEAAILITIGDSIATVVFLIALVAGFKHVGKLASKR